MGQFQFSTIKGDAATIERIATALFADCTPDVAAAAARRTVAIWNRFLYVSNESLGLDRSNEPPHERGWRGVTLGMLNAWLDAGKYLYPNRSCDSAALNRIVALLGEAEAILAAVPLAIPRSPGAEARS